MKKQDKNSIYYKVYNYPTKHKEGFTSAEIDKLLKDYPNITREQFNNAFGVNTCMLKGEETIYYHCDVELTLRCCVENRKPTSYEWD